MTRLGGVRNIKLEVLDEENKWVQNAQVLEATKLLRQEGYNIWPLIRPELTISFEKTLLSSSYEMLKTKSKYL